MSRSTAAFEALLRNYFSTAALDREEASVFALDADGAVCFVNSAWDEFAQEGAGTGAEAPRPAVNLGYRYFDAIAEPLRPFYRDLFARARASGQVMHPVSHEYECSSDVVFRKYVMQVYALGEMAGYLVVNSLVEERPHEREASAPDFPVYLDTSSGEGVIRQCSHCRRVQRVADRDRWDWVPAWVRSCPSSISHTICTVCFHYYYSSGED